MTALQLQRLLLAVAVVIVASWAARYLLIPAYFRPEVGHLVFAAICLVGFGVLALRRLSTR